MLNRAIASPSYTPGWWTDWRRGLTARQTKLLLRYVVALAVVCVLGCVYLAQMNVITNLSSATYALNQSAVHLEAANSSLMQRLAQLESPAAIATQAEAQDFTLAGAPTVVRVPQFPSSSAAQVITAYPVAQVAESISSQ